jgi:hypothetical protein
VTHYYGPWQSVPVSYSTRKERLFSLPNLTREDNEKRGMLVL